MSGRAFRVAICTAALLSGHAFGEWVKVDDFQGYQPDLLPKGANGWVVPQPEVTRAMTTADRAAPGNQALKLQRLQNVKSEQHDTLFHTGAINIPPASKGTVFMRFLIESGLDTTLGSTTGEKHQGISLKIGLAEATLNAGNCQAGIWVNGGSAHGLPSKPDKDFLVPVRRNQWYLLWLVVDNAQGKGDASAAYLQEEGASGRPTRIPGPILVQAKSARGILASVGVVKSRDTGLTDIWLDDLFVDNTGENLTDPMKSKAALGWKEKLEREASQYKHLLKKAATPQEAEKQARELLKALTPEERFALVCGDGAVGISGFPRLGIPPVVFSDASAGVNNWPAPVKARHAKTVSYPCLLLLSCTWNPALAEAYARSIGEECRSGGTHVLLAPSVNFYRVSSCGRNWEYPGEDPYVSSAMTAAYVKGVQSAGVAATLKVLVGNEIEFHRRGSDSRIDERTLNEIYLAPFRAGIGAGALAVMTAYNQLNGAWCGQDNYTGTTLLRKELGFQWLSMTDWIGTYDGVAVSLSGTDLEMPGGWALKKDREKVFGTEAIDSMALHVLKTCIYGGLYEPDFKRPGLEANRTQWEAVARRVNHEGITLLKNNGILPLSQTFEGKSVLVTGNNATRKELSGGGSGHVEGYNLKTYQEGLAERFPLAKVGYVEKPTDEELRAAGIIFVFPGFLLHGQPHEGEGSDRSFVVPDEALIERCVALNSKTIVCVTAGGGVRMDWAPKAAAIVSPLYGGQTGADALLDVLTGVVNPSGKLTFTIENNFADSPGAEVTNAVPDTSRVYPADGIPIKSDFFTGTNKSDCYVYTVDYKEGVFLGYRWYEQKKMPVRYPFGFGLSYTTFAYEGLKVEKASDLAVRVSFTVKNTGSRDGAEVAQVYVSDKVCSVPRPPQELKGFQKVFLKPGESRRVEIQLGEEAFRFWHPETKRWTVEPGEFEIRVGASSADIRLKETVMVPDNGPTGSDDRQTHPCGVKLSLVSEQPEAVIGKKHPGSEGNKYGYEGGSVLKLEGTYHLFTAEMVGDPLWVKMKLGHWTSPDRLTWTRRGTMYESSGDPTGKDPRASFWSPMPIYNEKEGRWNFFYVAYRAQVGPLGWNGRIWRAVSKVKGPAGIDGPWEDVGVILQPGPAGGAWEEEVMKGGVPSDKILQPGPESAPWEGSQGVDSFYPYQVGDTWLGFYGSCNGKNWFKVGLAEAPELAGPWKRLTALNPVGIAGTRGPENPVVHRLKSGRYIAVYEVVARENGFGYADSPDGIHWSKGSELPLTEAPKRLRKVRTPLGLVPEQDGSFTIFFTGYTRAESWGEVWMARVRAEE